MKSEVVVSEFAQDGPLALDLRANIGKGVSTMLKNKPFPVLRIEVSE